MKKVVVIGGGTMGLDIAQVFARSGYDLLLTPDGDTCWVECATARGEALIAQGAPFFRSVPTADLKARQLMLEEQCRAAFPPLPDMSDARNALLRGFHHPLWDELTPFYKN